MLVLLLGPAICMTAIATAVALSRLLEAPTGGEDQAEAATLP